MKSPASKILPHALLALATSAAIAASPDASTQVRWVASWQASPQPVWGADFIFPANVPTQLHDQTVRQIAQLSVGGERLRIVLSNTYGSEPITVGAATVARPGSDGAIDPVSLHSVTFNGQTHALIAPGASLLSDPVALPLRALSQVAVSIHLPEPTPMKTFHWDGRQTGWIVDADQTSAATLQAPRTTITARVLLSGIQTESATKHAPRALAIIGDSITDGATASLDQNTRWPDFLAARLARHDVAVLNAGISGARLLSNGMGDNALARLDRDVLAQPGIEGLIIAIGINDIAWPGTPFAPDAKLPTLQALKSGYLQLIEQARSRGLRVIGSTLAPFQNALPDTPLHTSYYSPEKDALRQQINDWVRSSGVFDAVIDFDAVLRDREQPLRMAAEFDSGDHLHPGDAGNQAMADAVDLRVLVGRNGHQHQHEHPITRAESR